MTTPTLQLIDRAIANIESNRRAHVSGPNKPPYPDYDNITQEILADYKRCRELIDKEIRHAVTKSSKTSNI